MSENKKPDGGSAFPREDYQRDGAPGQIGMTLRDWFAGKVAAGLCTATDPRGIWQHGDADDVAQRAYEIADAMIAARSKP